MPLRKLLWVYHPPIYALPEQRFTFWQTIVGPNTLTGTLKWLFRLPSDVGNEENTFLMQIKTILFAHHAYHARKRLRKIAEKNGDVVRQTIVSQSDSAYILELSDRVHRLIGVQK